MSTTTTTTNMADHVEVWLCEELGKLGIDASEDFARYILSIETAEDLEEYMLELLDGTDHRTRKFIKDLLITWRPYSNSKVGNAQMYVKPKLEENNIGKGVRKKGPSVKPGNQKAEPPSLDSCVPQGPGQDGEGARRKQKFVPLFSKEGQAKDVIHIAGRHVCECQAAKHSLVGNCTRCGRVVCSQEGSGPCLFCGNLVCTQEETDILSRGSKKSEKLRQYLMKDAPKDLLSTAYMGERDYLPHGHARMDRGFTDAEKHKDRLLDYDKTSTRRTQVIDDESDYFATDSNQWLSTADREALRKREDDLRNQRHESRKDRKVTLDFAGRRVIEATNDAGKAMYDVNDEVIQRVHYGASGNVGDVSNAGTTNSYLVNPNIVQHAPQFVNQETRHISKAPSLTSDNNSRASKRIQDRELQEMSDDGMCMSMHQPWASLLVAGIKVHEGRTWYATHRGRLWIAATAKTPDPQEVADVEQSYRYLLKNVQPEFPSHYPVGCLLGCVDLVDCLAQDPYREKFPEGESASPFVFICDNPRDLLVKFPVKGKHKIYKLDGHIHKAAKKGLR